MERTDVLLAARSTIVDTITDIAELVRSQPDLTTPIGGGSYWTVREAAVHLVVVANFYRELATGAPSIVTSLVKADVAVVSDQLISDVAESEPRQGRAPDGRRH